MAIAYFGIKLSDNWVETPEGYLIFKSQVIARTGFQRYKGHELDLIELAKQGVEIRPDDNVDLYRSPEEVFAPATIASFEMKSVTDGHPDKLLDVDDVLEHEEGQITNVREGKTPLESGDYPLLADLIVKSNNLIVKVKAGLRGLSCGYTYHVVKQGTLLQQVDIFGNHVALVRTGRAGPEASIKDAAITSTGRNYIMSLLDRILNSNRKSKIHAWAKDATPEEIAAAMDQMAAELEARDSTGHDSKHGKDCACKDCMDSAKDSGEEKEEKEEKESKDSKGKDSKGKDKGKDGKDSVESVIKGLDELFGSDADKDDDKEDGKDSKEGEDSEESEADDEALIIEPADRPKPLGPGTDGKDADAFRVEGAKAVLKVLKPFVARSGDRSLIKAFDTAARKVVGKSVGSGSYSAFATASHTPGKDAKDSIANGEKNAAQMAADHEKAYKARFDARQ